MFARKFSAYLLVLLLTTTAFAVVSFGARADESSSDAYGYYWTDSNSPSPTVTFDWVEISGTGTDVGFYDSDDDYVGPFAIGFDFEFYGNTYSMFNISSNGYIQFDDGSSESYNAPFPSASYPNNIVAPFWDDLIVYDTTYNYGSVLYETIGTTPNQQLVVEFYQVSRDYSSNLLTFELLLNETGEIWFQYLEMGTETGPSASAGIENADGEFGCQYSYGDKTLWNGLAVKFERGPIGFGPDASAKADWGTSAVYAVYLTNAQTFIDSFDITVDYSYLGWVVDLYDGYWFPLSDNNLNGVPDTGNLAPGETFYMLVYVTVPNPPTEQNETTVLLASSFSDPLVTDDVTLLTQAYQAHFGTTHSDWGYDSDSDGDYDELVVSAAVDAVGGGYIRIEADLYDSLGYYITSTWTYTELPAGPGTIELSFVGEDVYASLDDGPYEVDMWLYDSVWLDIDYETYYTTTVYLYTDFQTPVAMFLLPFSDYGMDTDSDGRYEYLVINTSLEVFEAGYYNVDGYIQDALSSDYLGFTENASDFEAGVYDVRLEFSSILIGTSSLNGPFDVSINLYDDRFNLLDEYDDLSGSYLYSDFEGPGAVFAPPHDDYAEDTDSDTYYNQVVVDIYIECIYTGLYDLVLYVYDMSWNTYAVVHETLSLTEGLTVFYEFTIDGEYIYSSGDAGWFTFEMYLYVNSSSVLMDYEYYDTGTYYYWNFDPVGASFYDFGDFGVDLDSDGYYDELVIQAYIDPLSTGDFLAMAYIYDPWYDHMDTVEEVVSLEEGVLYTWDIVLSGHDILMNGVSGSFHLYLYIYDVDQTVEYDYSSYTTAYYYLDDFDQIGAYFYDFDDYGVDLDSNGYYDELVIEVYIDPLSTGDFLVVADVYDYWGGYMGVVEEVVSLEEGVLYSWYIVLSSYDIQTNDVDGEYYLEMDIYDVDETFLYDEAYYYTSYYYVEHFDPIGAFFVQPYDDYGRDDDSDGTYDYLVVTLYVDASSTGYYDMAVYVYDPWGGYADYYWIPLFLNENEVTEVEVEIPASVVWVEGADGYWSLYMYVYDHYSSVEYDYDYYTTSYYSVSEFDPPPVEFDPPHSDYAIDLDSDYLYDYLIVDVELDCYEAGTYTVYADLYDYWDDYVTSLETTESMTVGNENVEFAFEGWILYYNGVSGYYSVMLTVEDESGTTIDYDVHDTNYYYSYNFEAPPAEFSPPHGDYALDDDDDSLYEYLIVNASVEAYSAGDFVVVGILYDDFDNPVDAAMVEVSLDAGVHDVQLWFDAWPIAASETDPLYVELMLFDPEMNEMDSGWYYLGSYYAQSDFDPTAPSIDSGWAYDSPVIDGTVSPDEWFGADAVDLAVADGMNTMAATMYVLNNATHLFILIDATGDTTESDGDMMMVSFDTGNDGVATDGHEDWFSIESSDAGTYTRHATYDWYYDDWYSHCEPFDPLLTDHEGLDGVAGFGASPLSAAGHRVYELCIPLSLLMVSPGDDIGFAGLPSAYDDGTGEYSTWPMFFWDFPPMTLYGDMFLSEEPPLTAVELSGDEGEAGWYVSDVEVTLTATGGTGGVANTSYNIDGAGWQTYADPFVIDDDGTHTVQYYSTDISGNDEPVRTVLVMIDTAVPHTSATVTGTMGEEDWLTTAAVVEFDATDASSGISVTVYRLDGGDWTELSGDTLEVSEDGAHVLEFFSVDVAGHEESASSVEFQVDMSAPVTTATVDGSMVTLTVTDSGSGVMATLYRIDGGEWVLYDGEFEVGGKGNHTVEYYSVDVAGNNETVKALDVQGASGSFAFGLDWWMVLLIGVIIILIAIGVIFGMRRKAKGSESLAAMKDIGPTMTQMVDDTGQPQQGPPQDEDLPPPPG